MVVKIAVLGKVQRGGGQPFDGGYFTRLANPDYYTAGGEPAGRWHGAGAVALGLTGIVESTAFANVLAGLRPDGTRLGEAKPSKCKRSKPKRVHPSKPKKPVIPGYDLCFSAPKSVSALWSVAAPAERKAIEEAFDVAVRSTLDWLASNIPLIRRGRGGRLRQFAELVIAQFDHGTSRVSQKGTWEPQLHRHCVIANTARGEDGRWSSVNSRLLHEWTRTLGPMFRATLARELQTRLGLGLSRPNDHRQLPASWFEIAGIPKALCQLWSSRRSEIETLLQGTTGLGNFSDAKAREAANLFTRHTKGEIPPRGQLFAEWRAVAREYGLTESAAEHLKKPVRIADPEDAFQQAWNDAKEQLEIGQSTFTFREAVQRVCEAAQTLGVNGDWLANRTRQELDQSREIRPLGIFKSEERFATEGMWQMEQKLITEFEKLRSTTGVEVMDSTRIDVLADHPYLIAEQRQAADQILSGKNSLRILTGVAGAGKSTTLDVIREAFEKEGNRVIGGAIAGIAKEELTLKAGMAARTVASYLHHLDKSTLGRITDRVRHDAKQLLRAALGKPTHLPFRIKIDNKTVLILDEAGMIDSPTLLQLGRIVRERGGTLILVGDTAQLQPIGPGAPLAHLVANEPSTRLSKNLRQQDPADREAADQLRHGNARAAIANYAERGRLVVAADRTQALEALVKTWSERGGIQAPEKHVIFTPTRAEAEAANRLSQRAREAAGRVDKYDSLRNGDGIICRGDRVLFHKNVFADGVRNGYRGEVIGVDRFRGKLTILLDGAEKREITIRLRDYGADGLTLSYAQTTHKGQGQTVDHAYLLLGGRMTDRELAYVQGTRGRLSTQLFVDVPHAGVDMDELGRSLARSRAKELAHDIAGKSQPQSSRSLNFEQRF
jgi:conjugative relaxase-like TrwC/TraI family protein